MQTEPNGATAPALLPPSLPRADAPIFHTPIEVALDRVVPGQNPRKTFDDAKINELAESFKAKGQLQAIKVRPKGSKLEVVFGERRVRAARIAGWKTIMATVVELGDREALEDALLENGARADVDEYEEAEAFRQLRDVHKRTPEEIAAKVGKSLSTVYARLKLAELDSKARELAQKNELPPSHALLSARIVGAERQRQAVKEIAEGGSGFDADGRPMSYRQAAEFVQREYMLALGQAPFDTTDAKLVAKAGACNTCPKRTGNQPALFHDIKSKDICTDSTCFKSKEDAVWKLKTEKAKETGQQVIDGAEAKKLFAHGNNLSYNAPFKKLDDEEWVGNANKKVKTILGKDAPPPVLARAPDGSVHELVPSSLVEKRIRELEPERPRSTGSSYDDGQAKFRKQQQFKSKVATAALAQLVDKAEMDKAGGKTLAFIAASLFRGGYYDGIQRVARRREIDKDKLEGNVPKMSDEGLAGLIVEIIAADNAIAGWNGAGYGSSLTGACKAFGVDLKKLDDAEKKSAKEKKKAKKSGTVTKLVCAIPGCGEKGKRAKGSPGLWCTSHAEKLSVVERKSIADRNKRLTAEGKLPAGTIKRLPPKSKSKAAKK